MKIDLQYPVQLPDGSAVLSVILRRPKMKDVRGFAKLISQGETFEAAVAIVAAVTGLPTEIVDELDPRDFEEIATHAGKFAPHSSR